MTVISLIASALLAQSAVATPPQATTETYNSTITATARTRRSYGWLTTSGPDAQQHYVAWIKVSDLDPATSAGAAAMTARLRRAAAVLCDMTADGADIQGYYNPGQRACLREAQDQASAQMKHVADAVREGRPVALLGVTSSPPR